MMDAVSSLRVDWENATVNVNGVSISLKSVLLTPVYVELLSKVAGGVFNRDLYEVLSPKVVTELTGIRFDNEQTLLPQVGNPDFNLRIELVKAWIADKEARKSQFEAARYMHMCLSRHLRKKIPFVLSGFLIDQKASVCASAFFAEVYNNFNLSEINKTYLLALLSRRLLMPCIRQVDYSDEIVMGMKLKGRFFSEEVDLDREFLTLFKLYKFLKMYEKEFGKTKVVEARNYVSTKDVVFGRKEIFKMFMDWLEIVDPSALEIFNPKDHCKFPKFFAELLLRVLAGRDELKIGFRLYDKKKKQKI
jgi:hypothetical protein